MKSTKENTRKAWNLRHRFMGILNRPEGNVLYPELQRIADVIKADMNRFVLPSIEEDGKFTYAKRPEDRYNFDKRVRTTLMRIIKRQYKGVCVDVPDSRLNAYCAAVTSEVFAGRNVREVTGEDILPVWL